MDFLTRNPFVRFLLPLVAGILLGYYVTIPAWVLYALFSVAALLLFSHLLVFRLACFYRFRWLYGCAIFLVFMGLGCWLVVQKDARTNIDLPQKEGIYRVRITDLPEEKPHSVLCRVSLQYFSDSVQMRTFHNAALLYFAKDSCSLALQRNDIVLVSCALSVPTNKNNPEEFDYAEYLRKQGIAAVAYVPAEKWQKTAHCTKFSLMELAQKCQHKLLSVYSENGITGNEFGVLAALTLGYKDSLEPEVSRSFSASGAMHVLAVSGLHVGIIFVILNLIFSLLLDRWRKTKVLKAVIIIFCLWIYAFITGLSPSVLRATIMFSFVRIGMSLDQPSQIYNTIALSAFLLLLCNPMLLFSVGFQLSYAAVVAIIFFQPKMSRLVYFRTRPMRWLWDLLSVSVAAQIGTAPLTMYYFNQFSNYFLLTNILVIPAASIIIYTAVVLLVLSPVAWVARLVAWLLNMEVAVLNKGVSLIENLPFSTSEVWISNLQMFLLMGCVVLLTTFYYSKRVSWLFAAMACILVFCGQNMLLRYRSLTSEQLIVYADSKVNMVQMTHGISHRIYTNKAEEVQRIAGTFALKHKLQKPEIVSMDTIGDKCFVFDNERFIVFDNDTLHNRVSPDLLYADWVIMGNVGKMRPHELFGHIKTKNVVLLASFPFWKKAEMEKLCTEKCVTLYDIGQSGALMLSCSNNNRKFPF